MTLFFRESLGVDRFLYDDLPRLRSATGERGQEKRPQPTCRSLTVDTCNKTRSRLRCLCSWLFILFMVFGNKTRAHTHLYTLFFISWTLWLFFDMRLLKPEKHEVFVFIFISNFKHQPANTKCTYQPLNNYYLYLIYPVLCMWQQYMWIGPHGTVPICA